MVHDLFCAIPIYKWFNGVQYAGMEEVGVITEFFHLIFEDLEAPQFYFFWLGVSKMISVMGNQVGSMMPMVS